MGEVGYHKRAGFKQMSCFPFGPISDITYRLQDYGHDSLNQTRVMAMDHASFYHAYTISYMCTDARLGSIFISFVTGLVQDPTPYQLIALCKVLTLQPRNRPDY
ncbi:uncharacterized protein N7484_006003 [Penicillium longicatenatum]|uniref:uncharacterized protein n=1 Tax=Penicillium longicatenatum TaxID=1561947 RepID=UPI00254737BD|nr:uncharacterized protein N7484_006003 [Penicillium longicatenatum]KAJ5643496.1 hypothetical protein N7484_006003 [Penicillium longicatenatum]